MDLPIAYRKSCLTKLFDFLEELYKKLDKGRAVDVVELYTSSARAIDSRNDPDERTTPIDIGGIEEKAE